jgi:signal transduction histidine kinase
MGEQGQAKLAMEGVVHDLNNVFQTILHAAFLISADEAHRASADIVARGVAQCRRILGLEGSGESEALLEVVERAVSFVHDSLEVSGGPALRVSVTAAPEIGIAKAPAMERALVNLLVNAARAAESERRSRVGVQIEAVQELGQVVMRVTDDGPGIPNGLLQAIFTPRFSVNEGGEGLGLHIVASVVREFGGTIEAANAPSGGAVFTIRFPAEPRTIESSVVVSSTACAG